MWQMIKNDPLLKTIAVLILGVLGFGFAFNIMFGSGVSGSMGGEGEMMSGSNPFSSSLTYILVIAFKLLLIAAVIAALVALIKLANRHLIKGEGVKMSDSFKNDPAIKAGASIVLSIAVLLIIIALFSGVMGNGSSEMYGFNMNSYSMIGNGVQGISLIWILTILLKVLMFVSVIGLLAGVAVLLYQNHSTILENFHTKRKGVSNKQCSNCNQPIPEEYTFCSECGAKVKQNCESCGAEIRTKWKCCPECGKEI